MVTHMFPPEMVADAFHLCSDIRNGIIKVRVVDELEATS